MRGGQIENRKANPKTCAGDPREATAEEADRKSPMRYQREAGVVGDGEQNTEEGSEEVREAEQKNRREIQGKFGDHKNHSEEL